MADANGGENTERVADAPVGGVPQEHEFTAVFTVTLKGFGRTSGEGSSLASMQEYLRRAVNAWFNLPETDNHVALLHAPLIPPPPAPLPPLKKVHAADCMKERHLGAAAVRCTCVPKRVPYGSDL